jgi:acyl transferase domain-containing protein
VIKMVMAMRHGVLPRTLHIDEPSSQIDWSAGAIELLREEMPWPAGRTRRAGVSSFGVSGTNAHVILEQAPRARAQRSANDGSSAPAVSDASDATVSFGSQILDALPWVLSGKSQAALAGQAGRLLERVQHDPEAALADVAFSLASRSAFEHRAVVIGAGRDELLDGLRGLDALEHGPAAPNVVQGVAGEGRVAFLFTGQGAQRVGMGSELYQASPVFRVAFDQVCEELDPLLGRSLRDIVFDGDSAGEGLLDQTLFTQAGLFAFEVALYRLVEALGPSPDFLIGHSIGELAAAHVAGVFSLADACKLVAARGELMNDLPAGGVMIAIQASEQEILETLAGHEHQLALAAINGPDSVVVSGDQDPALEIAAHWEQRNRKTKRLRVSHAFHSPRVEPMLDAFREIARTITYAEPRLPIISNLTGARLTAEQARDPDYWVLHARNPVRYLDGTRTLAACDVSTYIELGPDAVLSAITHQCLESDETKPLTVALTRRERPELPTLLRALAHTWVNGTKIDWTAPLTITEPKPTPLPTYAFQHQRYWLEHEATDPTPPRQTPPPPPHK